MVNRIHEGTRVRTIHLQGRNHAWAARWLVNWPTGLFIVFYGIGRTRQYLVSDCSIHSWPCNILPILNYINLVSKNLPAGKQTFHRR